MNKHLFVAIGLAMLVGPALGADPWHQSFNKVSTIPWRNNFLGGVSIGTGAVDGPAAFAPWSERGLTTSGAADFGELKIYIEQAGQIADHRATAISHQIYNVTDPAVAAGSAGTLFLSFTMGGITTIVGEAGNSVTASLSVTLNIENNGTGGTVLDFFERVIEPPADAATGIASYNVEVPFTYGEDFRVTTRFGVRIRSDLEYDLSNRLIPGSTFESITAAFDNSATLDAIYLPEGATIALNSVSDYDPAQIVRFGTPAPVPAPPVLAVFLPALLMLRHLGARPGQSLPARRIASASRAGSVKHSS